MIPVTAAQFRTDFPEFADTTQFPDALLNTWLAVAAMHVANADRWGPLWTLGQELAAAHWIVIALRDRAAAASGAPPGAVVGLTTAKAAGDVSASLDYTLAVDPGAGFWNQTSYGQRYFSLALLIGAGGMQLSPDYYCLL